MNRNLLLLSLSMMIWGVGEGMFMFFQPLYLEELGADPQQIGFILGVIAAIMTAVHLPAGYLADKIGRKPLMLLAWFLGVAATWIMALASSLNLFVVGSALYGVTIFVVAPMNSYITTARGDWSVGRALTLISAAYNIGAFIGPLLGGYVGNLAGLRANFQIAAIIFVISTALILFIKPQPVEKRISEATTEKTYRLLDGRFLSYLAVTFFAMFSMYLAQPLSQNYLQNQRGLDLLQIGQLLAARSAGIVLLNLTLGYLNARLGAILAQVGVAFFTLLLWQGQSFQVFALGYFLLGSYQTARALTSAQGRVLFHSRNMGLAYGIIETTMAAATILAPPLAGWLYTNNPSLMYSTSLALIVAALVVIYFFSPLRASAFLAVKDAI